MATTTNPTLPTGAVKPTAANQTTSSKATSLIESLVATPTFLQVQLYLHNYRM